MALASFDPTDSSDQTLRKIGDYVRLVRRSRGQTQAEFASECGIPLRTFKRFEAGQSDSLTSLIKVACVFERTYVLSLLFPVPTPQTAKSRDAVTAFAEVRKKIGK